MELTGWGLPTTLACVAVGLFVLIVLGRPRFRRRGMTATARGVLVVLLNLIVVLLVACLLNNANGFYANWNDLFSAAPPPRSTHSYGADPVAASGASVQGAKADSQDRTLALPPLPQPGKRVQKYVVKGAESGFKNDVWVRLPKGYDPAKADVYPVIIALHGYPGHPRAFKTLGDFYPDIDDLVAEHQLRDPIVVMPEINPRGYDTECVNLPHGPQADTWLAHDIPEWVRSHFRVATNRSSWATWGYSFGGYCAMSLAVRHPEEFSAAVAFQGYTRPNFGDDANPLAKHPALAKQYDLAEVVSEKRPPVAIWIFSSAQDALSYPSVKRLGEVVQPPTSLTTVIYKRGGHRNLLWFGLIRPSFEWLGQSASGFKPPEQVHNAIRLSTVASR